jgi:hypothetical protein
MISYKVVHFLKLLRLEMAKIFNARQPQGMQSSTKLRRGMQELLQQVV